MHVIQLCYNISILHNSCKIFPTSCRCLALNHARSFQIMLHFCQILVSYYCLKILHDQLYDYGKILLQSCQKMKIIRSYKNHARAFCRVALKWLMLASCQKRHTQSMCECKCTIDCQKTLSLASFIDIEDLCTCRTPFYIAPPFPVTPTLITIAASVEHFVFSIDQVLTAIGFVEYRFLLYSALALPTQNC